MHKAHIPFLGIDVLLEPLALTRKPPPHLGESAWDDQAKLTTQCAPRSAEGQYGLYVQVGDLVKALGEGPTARSMLHNLVETSWLRVDFGKQLEAPVSQYGTLKMDPESHKALISVAKQCGYEGGLSVFLLRAATVYAEKENDAARQRLRDDDDDINIGPGSFGRLDDDPPGAFRYRRSEQTIVASAAKEFGRELKTILDDFAKLVQKSRPKLTRKKKVGRK